MRVRRVLALIVLLVSVIAVLAGLRIWRTGLDWEDPPWRDRLREAIAQASGRPVRAMGRVSLHLSGAPVLIIEDLRMAGSADPDAPDWLRAGSLEVELDLGAWIRSRRWQLKRVRAHDLLLDPGAGPARASVSTGGGDPAPAMPAGLAIDELHIERMQLMLGAQQTDRHRVVFDAIDGHARAGAALEVALAGRLDAHEFAARIDGAPLDRLLASEQPWPLRIALDTLGASLSLDGAIERIEREGRPAFAGEFVFGAGAPDAQALAARLDADLPDLGATGIAGRVRWQGRQLSLRELVGTVGASQFDGELTLELDGVRPRVVGRVHASTLDMRPFLGQTAAPAAQPERSLAQWYRDFARARIDPSLLRRIDARVALRVDDWLSLPGGIGNARVDIDLRDGRLRAPVSARIAGVDLRGDLDLDSTAEPPRAELALGTIDTPLGGLAQWLFGLRGLHGALGGVAFRVQAQGGSAREIVESTSAYLAIARGGLSYGNDDGERPVGFGLESLRLLAEPGAPVRIDIDGSLLEQPLQLEMSTDSLQDLLARGAGRIALDARSRSARLRIRGRAAPGSRPQDPGQVALTLDASASDMRDLERWSGMHLNAAVPMRASARIGRVAGNWRIDDIAGTLGSNRVSGRLARVGALWSAALSAEQIDVDELEHLFARASGSAAPGDSGLDLPVLPANVSLADIDLEVHVGRITRSTLDISALDFTTRIRDGHMSASPLSMTALGIPLRGALEVDMREQVPRAQWWLMAEQVDAGALLRRLALSTRVDARVDALRLHLLARGRRLGDLLSASSLSAELEGGHIRLLDPNTRGFANIELANGSLIAAPGQPVRGALVGRIGRNPVALAIETATLAELVRVDRGIGFVLDASLAGAHAALSGRVERPVGSAAMRMHLALTGDRLDAWNELLGVAMPPWGPYTVDGSLSIDAHGYGVDGLRLGVGGSSLSGGGSLDTSVSPPRIDVRLDSPLIEFDDFPLHDWSAFTAGATPQAGSTPSLAGVGEQAARASDRVAELFGPEVLRRFDATLRIVAGLVRSRGERLGGASMQLSIEDGRARFDPVRLAIGAGSASIVLDYAPSSNGVDIDMRLDIERLDYGLLARRVSAATDLAGDIDLGLTLRSHAPALSQAMAHGNGSLSFLVRPRQLRANVFDLWATNLFVTLVSRLDPRSASAVNCGLGQFTLDDGILRSKRMLIDTTRVRVLGQGEVDFNARRLSMRLSPWPKTAEFFSLATPIEVGGSFDDYTIGPRAGDIVATGIRLLGSIVWVPLMKIAGRESPADGGDVCEPRAGPDRGEPSSGLRHASPAADMRGYSPGALEFLGGP